MGAEPDALVGGIDREEIVPERLAAAFMARATTIRTRKGQLLIAEGSTADDVYLIVGGRLHISMIAANGRETILRDMGPGRLVVEMSAISTMPRPASVTAVEDSSLGMLSGAGRSEEHTSELQSLMRISST